jgi:ATP-dependent Clp protease adaptor protein ClpS
MEKQEIEEIDISELLSDSIELSNNRKLILYNDDVNSFDYVIYCLCCILNIDSVQAEQIANIVHNKGKCDIKSGSYEELLSYYEVLINCKLNCKIE